MAGGRIDQRADLELFEADPQDPVLWRAPEGAEAVPARHGFTEGIRRYFRRTNVLVYVHRLIAMVSLHLGWK